MSIPARSSMPDQLARALFDLAQVDPLRVFANVPQAYSQAIKVGMPAYVTLQEFPGQKFTGTVARTADAIDPATRTLVTEVDVPNPDGRLLPGSYGELHFKPAVNVAKLTVPVNAMLFRQEGPRLAVVGPDNKVQLRPIVDWPRLRCHPGDPRRHHGRRSHHHQSR